MILLRILANLMMACYYAAWTLKINIKSYIVDQRIKYVIAMKRRL